MPQDHSLVQQHDVSIGQLERQRVKGQGSVGALLTWQIFVLTKWLQLLAVLATKIYFQLHASLCDLSVKIIVRGELLFKQNNACFLSLYRGKKFIKSKTVGNKSDVQWVK